MAGIHLNLRCCNNSEFCGYYSEDECLGFYCKFCWKEWLLEEFISATLDPVVYYKGKRYLSPVRSQPSQSNLCQVTTSREEINPNFVAESVKCGDHLMWHRPYFLWHHAIVEEVNGHMLTLIHFTKQEKEIAIMRTTVDARQEWGTLYLVVYSAQVRQYNPVELVLARAKALIGIGGFQLFKKNCENFATFSKTGINVNQQSNWFDNKLGEIWRSICHNAGSKAIATVLKVGAAELLELGAEEMKIVTHSAELVGAGVIIAFEGGICLWNLWQLYQEYKRMPRDGRRSMSRKDFIKEMVEQISQRFFAAGFGAGLGVAMTSLGTVACPGLGTVAGAVLGVIGGCIGSALGHVIGVTFGQFISHAIVKTIMTNDRAVMVSDLRPGDHIVLHGNLLHPRCHAIFVRNHQETRQIIVIRHSYQKGVILDAVDYSGCDPLFKVTYPNRIQTYSSEEIVTRAIRAVADYDSNNPYYNLLWNNCKHFVYSITVRKV